MAKSDPHLAYLAFKGNFKRKPFEVKVKAGSTNNLKDRWQKYSAYSSFSMTDLTQDDVIYQSEWTDYHSARVMEQRLINALRDLRSQLAPHSYINFILDNHVNSRDPKKYGHFDADNENIKLVTSRISQGLQEYLSNERQYVLDTEYLIGEKRRNDFSWSRALNFNFLNIFK